jgi:leader peptidase (prepilin peptidase)/N-methyltransferase
VTPWWVALVVALVMGVVGHLTGLRLATGGYRIAEDEADHAPGRPWWPGPLTALLSALAAWAIGGVGDWAVLPTYLLFAWLTVGLIWIDLDVHRLPVGLVVPTAWWLAALLVVATIATGEPRWQGALIGFAVMGGIYLVLGLLPGGGVGGGDVRLAPVIGALIGWLSLAHLAVGLMAGFLIGGLGAIALLVLGRAGLKTSIAYGPAMCLGAWVAIVATSRILTWVTAG